MLEPTFTLAVPDGVVYLIVIAIISIVGKLVEWLSERKAKQEALGETNTESAAERLKRLAKSRKTAPPVENSYERNTRERQEQTDRNSRSRHDQLKDRATRTPKPQPTYTKPAQRPDDIPDIFKDVVVGDHPEVHPYYDLPHEPPPSSQTSQARLTMIQQADAHMKQHYPSTPARKKKPEKEPKKLKSRRQTKKTLGLSLGKRESLKKAIILKEILDQPIAMRESSHHYPDF